MHLIAVTDIFGKTRAFVELIRQISHKYETVVIIDPYDNEDLDFCSEAEAYEYFQKNVGVENYIEKLKTTLHDRELSNLVLLGFSVGATAIWVLSEKLKLYKNTKGICFYSSQVRKYLDVSPKIQIDFYFSRSEQAYDVAEVIAKLSKRDNVKCVKTNYLHGFMNRKSQNFIEHGYSTYLAKI